MNSGEPLRVLALLEASSISGSAKAVLEMAYEAKADCNRRREIQIHVACFSRGPSQSANALTQALEEAHIPFSFIREKGRFDTSVIDQIRDLVTKLDAHVIWSNSVKSHFLVYRAKAKRCRWVAFHHGYTTTDFKMRVYNELDRISLRHAQRVLTVCQPFAAQMKARGVKAGRICVQHMAIRRFSVTAAEAAALRAELRIPPEAKLILSVGRLSREKGHVDLIAAFADLVQGKRASMTDKAPLRLVIAGDGPERARLERQARRSGLGDSILFAGHRDDAKRFYGISDVFALPSYSEGTPNVLLEAMCAGVPVVATRVGGIPELVVDGRNALLVAPANPAEMAKALRNILQSADLRNELTRAGEAVVDAHSPRHYFESVSKVFFEVEGE